KAAKVLWIVGQLEPKQADGIKNALSQIKQLPQHAILTETTSNLSENACHSSTIDRVIVPLEDRFDDFQPEVLIHLGGQIVSKKIKALLRKNKNKFSARIHNTAYEEDTFLGLNLAIPCEPVQVLHHFGENCEAQKDSNYNALWKKHIQHIDSRHLEFQKKSPYSDFYLFQELASRIPNAYNIFWGNSSPIRYAQLFTYQQKNLLHFANRGTSGIEGNSSTASGYALKSEKSCLLVTGDISFYYDINGLEAAPENLKVLLINNSGGNIFRIIDGPDKIAHFDTYLETTHNKTAVHLAAHFGFQYMSSSNEKELPMLLDKFFETQGKTIAEIHTPRFENPEVLKQYFQFLKEN
ncbi:MAG: thiamine pyrophosphate-dependent enzyme, partial [Luteibaculum sp.]